MAERQKFDELVLKVALERDLTFITNIVLDKAVISPQLLSLLLQDQQQNIIVSLVTRPDRPLFISNQMGIALKKKDARIAPNVTKKLTFVDVVESMIDSGVHTNNEVIELIGLMQNAVDRINSRSSQVAGIGNNDDEPPKYLDYEELF